MDDKEHKKGIILDFTLLGRALKMKAHQRAFKRSINDDLVLHARRAQVEIDKAYQKRSKRIAKRLRNEVLTQLMKVEEKS